MNKIIMIIYISLLATTNSACSISFLPPCHFVFWVFFQGCSCIDAKECFQTFFFVFPAFYFWCAPGGSKTHLVLVPSFFLFFLPPKKTPPKHENALRHGLVCLFPPPPLLRLRRCLCWAPTSVSATTSRCLYVCVFSMNSTEHKEEG
ncbi:MAG: hypothetical protein BYD32DRAFT_195722 [Podila humilis]|nr:MAG: hypothetical protein BYD32DRAFT_195722 [Podila humilis]